MPSADPAPPLLLAVILLAIDCARSLDDLAGWWQDHKPVLRILSPPDLAAAVAHKNARKHLLQSPAHHATRHGYQPRLV